MRRVSRPVLLGTSFAAMLVLAGWYFVGVYAPREERAAEERWQALLAAMADDRKAAIERWTGDLLGNASVIAAYPTVRYLFGSVPGGPLPFPVEQGPRAHVSELLAGRVRAEGLAAGYLVDRGAAVLAASDGAATLEPECIETALAAIAAAAPMIDMHRHADGTAVTSAVAPVVIAPGAAPVAAVVLSEDASAWLYPFLRSGAASTSSAETVLVRHEGDRIRFLVPLRHRPESPLTFTRPVSSPGLAALVAFGGGMPSGRYQDYRGEDVLAAVRPVAGTPWGLVVKVDEAEAFADVRKRIGATGAAASAFLLALAIGGAAWWRLQRVSRELAVANAGARFAALVDQANDAVLSVALDGTIVDANRRAEALYGRSREELRGMSVSELRPPESRGETPRHLATVLETGRVVFETVHQRRDGVRIPVEVSSRRVADDRGGTLLSIVRDISERRAAEARIARLNRLLRTISEINQLIVREPGRDRLLAEACRILVEHGEIAAAWVGRADPQVGVVRPLAAAGVAPGFLGSVEVRCDDTPEGRGPAGTAIREGRTLVVADWESDERVAPWRQAAAHLGFRTSAAVPIRVSEQDAAVLSVYGRSPGELDEEVVTLLEEVAADLGFALTAIEARRVREAAVEALAESEERLRLAMGAAALGMFDWDITTGHVAWSGEHERLWGLAKGSFDGRYETFRNGVHPDDIAGLEAEVAAARESRRTYAREFRVVQPDGSERWIAGHGRFYFDHAGAPVRMIGVVRDISERRRLMRRLHDSEQRHRLAVEGGGLGTWDWNIATGHVVFNERWAAMLGYSLAEVEASLDAWERLLHPDDATRVKAAIDEHLRGETPYYETEHRLRAKAGGWVWVLDRGQVIERDPDGRPLRACGTHADISTMKRAQDRLRASEELFAGAFRESPAAISITRDEDGRFVDVNDAFLRLFGLTRAEVAGKTSLEVGILSPPSRRDLIERQEPAGGLNTAELSARARDGRELHLLFSSAPITVDGDPCRISTLIDITDRKAAEVGIRKSEERLRFALDTAQLGGWDLDLVDHTAFRTPGHDRIFGYPGLLPEWTYERFLEHVLPEDRAEVDGAFKAATSAGTDWSFECRIRRVDGAQRWIWAAGRHQADAAGRARRMAGIVQDITERKRAEEALRSLAAELELRVRGRTAELEERQAALEREVEERRWTQMALERAKDQVEDLYQNAPCGYCSIDADGRYVSINDTELAWLGRRRDEVVGRLRFPDVVAPASREAYAAAFARLKEHGRVDGVEFELVRADGSTFWVLLNSSAVRDAAGRFVASRSTTFDISDRKIAEDEARRLAREVRLRATELEAANAELEAFSYSVSHDLRAPLRAIDGFSLALLEDNAAQLDATGRGYLDRVRAATARMAALIDDLLRLSRVTRHELVRGPVDLAAISREVLAELAAQEPGRHVEVSIAPDLMADADPHLARVLLTNLLGNAWKFTGRTDRATIVVGSGKAPDGATVFSVTDNGAGFDPAYAARLFQPFQRLHAAREFPGTGIGLATARRIASRHGGRIWAESAGAGGATFHFTLEPTRDAAQ